MSYKIPKILSCTSSMITIFLVAFFLAHDYNKVNINNLTPDEKVFTGVLIFSEIILGFTILYLTLAGIWSGMILCCNDSDTSVFTFSFYKVIFLISGIISNFFIFSKLVTKRIIIDELITASGWLLVSNMFFIILITVINKIYQIREKKNRNDYEEF